MANRKKCNNRITVGYPAGKFLGGISKPVSESCKVCKEPSAWCTCPATKPKPFVYLDEIKQITLDLKGMGLGWDKALQIMLQKAAKIAAGRNKK